MKRAILAVMFAALSIGGCDYHEYHHHGHPQLYSYIVSVDNHTNETFEIDLDGHFFATVRPFDSVSAEVLEGSHRLAAYDRHGTLRADRDFYLDRDFVWVLDR